MKNFCLHLLLEGLPADCFSIPTHETLNNRLDLF